MFRKKWWRSEALWLGLFAVIIGLVTLCLIVSKAFQDSNAWLAVLGFFGGGIAMLIGVSLLIAHVHGDPLEDKEENEHKELPTHQEHVKVS